MVIRNNKESKKLPTKEDYNNSNLEKVLNSYLKLRIQKDLNFAEVLPLLWQGENKIIFPNTINVIQGQAGVHKSRLAEIIASSLLKNKNNKRDLLGFNRKDYTENLSVVYFDTERNLTEQFPRAIQKIQIMAGYNKTDNPENFKYFSLLPIERKYRFETLKNILQHLRDKDNNKMIVILDVSTDCIDDFNRTDSSMNLIDLMNTTINDQNVVFICLIHENPGSEKARGHFGTEIMNKSSTVMQISFEKDSNRNDTELIKIKYLKCRTTKKPDPLYIKYCSIENTLIRASELEVNEYMSDRKKKANVSEIIPFIEITLGESKGIPKSELIKILMDEFNIGERTIEQRLNDIVNTEPKQEFYNNNSEKCFLIKYKVGKEIYYKLGSELLLN